MADPSACRDWYFRPARNAFNFGNKKKSHGGKVCGIRGEGGAGGPTPSPEKKSAYKTFFVLKERLAIIGRLLCLVAQILLLTF